MANIFSKSANRLPRRIGIGVALFILLFSLAMTYYATPKYSRVGYQPKQPVAFDHALHAGQLGMDCRYCHSSVEQSEHSLIPDAATCMNCHNQIHAESPALAPIRQSVATGEPVPWVRIHKTPDYVFFNHAVHVKRGISCVECHGDVHEMDTVYQAKSFSMAFCLDCHRNPTDRLRPPDKVYDLDWEPKEPQSDQAEEERYIHQWDIQPPQSCSGCHR